MTEPNDLKEPRDVAEALVAETLAADPALGAGLVEHVAPPRSQWWDVWDQFKSHKGALAGAAVFVSILVGVVFGPLCLARRAPPISTSRAMNARARAWPIRWAPISSAATRWHG